MAALQTAEALVPGSYPAYLSMRTGRVTVYTVKSRGREGNLHLGQKKERKKKIGINNNEDNIIMSILYTVLA